MGWGWGCCCDAFAVHDARRLCGIVRKCPDDCTTYFRAFFAHQVGDGADDDSFACSRLRRHGCICFGMCVRMLVFMCVFCLSVFVCVRAYRLILSSWRTQHFLFLRGASQPKTGAIKRMVRWRDDGKQRRRGRVCARGVGGGEVVAVCREREVENDRATLRCYALSAMQCFFF